VETKKEDEARRMKARLSALESERLAVAKWREF
jgi:hypothetical protein